MDNQTEQLTERLEILTTPTMRRWIDIAARRQGLNASAWMRAQAAWQLSASFGDRWMEDHDHPEGDQEK